jgi:hypothetical protein
MPERHLSDDLNFDGEHPASRFAADCALQLEVCKSLLALADSLPNNLSPQAMAHLARVVPLTLCAHTAFQAESAFPLLKRRNDCDTGLLDCFARLEKQHVEVASADDELLEQMAAAMRGETIDPEVFAYVIRNAAERRREHVEWEMLLLGKLFPINLTPAEREGFRRWASANPWPIEGLERGPTHH